MKNSAEPFQKTQISEAALAQPNLGKDQTERGFTLELWL